MSVLRILKPDDLPPLETKDALAILRARLSDLIAHPPLAAGLAALTPDLAAPSTWRLRDYAIAVHRLEQLSQEAREPLRLPDQLELDEDDRRFFGDLVEDMYHGVRRDEATLIERLLKARTLAAAAGEGT